MTEVVEVRGRMPTGRLAVDDLPDIDLNVGFELVDGRLELLPVPTPWHQHTAARARRLLEPHHPHVTGGVPIDVGRAVRCPDVVALVLPTAQVLRERPMWFQASQVSVVVEVITHSADRRRDTDLVARDRQEKWCEYAEAGIPEYWIIDETSGGPTDATVEICRLR